MESPVNHSLLGTDGAKMSKSRGNAIALSATADETARLVTGARTDARRDISYEPDARPEVSSLVLLAALCQGREPERVAAEIGARGAGQAGGAGGRPWLPAPGAARGQRQGGGDRVAHPDRGACPDGDGVSRSAHSVRAGDPGACGDVMRDTTPRSDYAW